MTAAMTGGLVTFGETMGLVTSSGIGSLDIARDARISIGGAESNVAIGLARLGVPVCWIGRLGRDAIGDLVERRLKAEGIDTVAIRDDACTGIMLRHSRTGELTHVDYHRAGSAASRLRPGDVPSARLDAAAVLHVTGITTAISTTAHETVSDSVARARAMGVTVSLDVNYRSKLWNREAARTAIVPLLRHADIVFAGVDEAQLLLDSTCAAPLDLAHRLADLGPAEVIVKDGSRGCSAVIEGHEYVQAALEVKVLDPVGAGDAFVAGYLAEWMSGADPEQRLRTASAMGAYAVTVPGDCELLPTRAELAHLTGSLEVVR